MAKILLVSLLLMMVYSWDEFRFVCKSILREILYPGRPQTSILNRGTDKFISSLIMLSAIPIALGDYLLSSGPQIYKLAIAGSELLLITIAASTSVWLIRYMNGAIVFQPWLAPVFGLADSFDGESRKTLSKITFYLSLPELTGITLKLTYSNFTPERFLAAMDILLQVLIGAFIIRLAIALLQHSGLRRLKKFTHYFRVILGLVLSAALIIGLK